jgi:protoheme IX farnesyltransferase
VGDAQAARIVFASTVALVAASLAPLLFGAGWLYGIGAAAGGAHFLHRTWRLARTPSRATAMGAFFASLVQLSALLVVATLDSFMR